MKNIAVFVSGGGTNLQALIDAEKRGELINGKIALVISSSSKAYALKRAEENGIPSMVISKRDCLTADEFDEKILLALTEHDIGLVVFAGYLSIISARVTGYYKNRIINVHPSLIPSFCGKGYYGLKVHEAALERGVKLTGATVHFVNEIPDGGAIIFQKAVEVLPDDTPKTLQKRVMEEAEWQLLPRAVSLFCQGKIAIDGNRSYIDE